MSYCKRKLNENKKARSFQILRKCGKCGKKTRYINTERFRINANGNNIDVWLIYQCEKCKHTYNLPIFERIKPHRLEQGLYNKFMENDMDLARDYGRDRSLFKQLHLEIE